MSKKLPSEYYDITDGIFLSKKILHSFGRRNGLITQLLLDIWEKSIKENKLLNGFAFISNDELFEKTAYNIKSNAFKNFKNCHAPKHKWEFLTTETFGVEDGLFFKINLKKLFSNVIPEFEKEYDCRVKNSTRYGTQTKSEEI